MKLARFRRDGATRLGVLQNGSVFDVSAAGPGLSDDMRSLLASGPAMLQQLKNAAMATDPIPLASVQLEAPITNPQKFLAIGMNYQDHAEEARRAGLRVPETQLWFNKQVSCITGPYDPVQIPTAAPDQVDYEGELGVIIGRRCRHVARGDAAQVIAGYCVLNDVSVRDWQGRSPTFTLGKSWDTHGPLGPWIVTADEIADPHNLTLRTLVNGELRQQASTSLLIFDVWEQIEYLSTVMTLEPGDVLATGTCAGVGIAMNPPRFLQPGDVVRVEIDGVGAIENAFVSESAEPVRADMT